MNPTDSQNRRLSISGKLLLGFSIFTVIVLLTGGSGIFFISKMGNLIESLNTENIQAIGDLNNAKLASHSIMIKTYRYLGTQDPDELRRISKEMDTESQILRSLLTGTLSSYADALELFNEFDTVRLEVMSHHFNFNTKVAYDLINTRGQSIYQALDRKLNVISAKEGEVADSRIQAGLDIKDGVTLFLAAEIVIRIMLNALVAYLIFRSVTRPLHALVTHIKRLSKSSDFSIRLEENRKDELGDAARAMNSLTSSLQEIIGDIGVTLNEFSRGNFNVQLNNQLSGDLALLKRSINQTAKQTGETIRDINQVMDSVSTGDFSKRINLSLEGELADLSENINRTFDDLENTIEKLEKEIVVRTEAERLLKEKSTELVSVSRQLGRADIAASTLHNVGNALNSLSASTHSITSAINNTGSNELARFTETANNDPEAIRKMLSDPEKSDKFLQFIDKISQTQMAAHSQIEENLGRLDHHIEHLKRIISTQQKFTNTSSMVSDVEVDDVIKSATDLACLSPKEFDIDLPNELPPIESDRDQIMQILLNLISNARHAIAASGNPPKYHFEIELRGEFIGIKVEDNGSGMTPEVERKLFDQGFTTKSDGNGIGLHNSSLLANSLGGKLEYINKGPGKGAVFSLVLPIKRQRKHAA